MTDFLPGMHRIAGGAEYAVQRMLEEQAALGMEIDLITTRRDIPAGGFRARRHFQVATLDMLAPQLLFSIKNFFIPADPRSATGVGRALAESCPDVVHFHNLHFLSLAAIRAAARQRLPIVLSVYDYWIFCPSFMLRTDAGSLCARGHGAHCVDCMGTRRARLLRPVKRELFRLRPRLLRSLTACVDRFVVLSEASALLLQRHGVDASRVCVVPLHIWKDAVTRPLAGPGDRRSLVYAGWLEERKGLHVVIEALAILKQRGVTVGLEVLGLPISDEYRDRISGLIARYGLSDVVTLAGKQTREALLDAFDRALAVVVPEQWENMSPVILTEAMAAGKCVVASRVGGIPSFLTHRESGLLAERDDPEDFARQIQWALHHPADVAAIGAAARRAACRHFDPTAINRRTMALYTELSQRDGRIVRTDR